MKAKDPFVQMAFKLLRLYESAIPIPRPRMNHAVACVLDHNRLLDRQLSLYRFARQRGWSLAARQMEKLLVDNLEQLGECIDYELNLIRSRSCPAVPTIRELHGELRQLNDEFPGLDLNVSGGLISAITDTITLEQIELGSFRIQLDLARLVQRTDSTAFIVEALEPNPPASKLDVVHPHIKNGRVCCGEASVPISLALTEGRLADAFLSLNSVLRTYNSGSAHVSLDEWSATPCSDCGSYSDGGHFCRNCGRVYCDDCFGSCDTCGENFCNGCLEHDAESGQMCCRNCRKTCDRCGRVIPPDEESNGLCPDCSKTQQQETEIQNELNCDDPNPGTSNSSPEADE